MKVVIFGTNGKTGSLILKHALANGHQVVAYIRRAGSILIENPNLKIVVGNLDETLKLRDAISGADACVSALGGGSLTKRSPEFVKGIDNIVTIMEQEVVPRFIYLSSIGAGESKFYIGQPMRFLIVNAFLSVPLADHNANETRLANSKLKWTIVRPGGLTDGPLTSNLLHGSEKIKLKGNASISRENVAAFMVSQLNESANVKKYVWLYE
jgi:putative NADH-flavin reductase